MFQITGFSGKHGYAAVHLRNDSFPDFLGMLADNPHLCAGGSHQHQLIQDQRVGHDQDQSIQYLFRRISNGLNQKNAKIKHIHENRNRNPQIMIEHQRRNIHTSGRCPRADHDSKGGPDPQAGKYGA